jgi:hypothetical protein
MLISSFKILDMWVLVAKMANALTLWYKKGFFAQQAAVEDGKTCNITLQLARECCLFYLTA